ncbi:MAG TPA: hypothetical protein VIF33_00345 [Casimicrobiaceae bacterium]|jgi:ABC-type uncharacterized transport system ATPase subunit
MAIIILDSVRIRSILRAGIRTLKQEGVSVILSESDLSHSREMLDVVIAIDRGEIVPHS